MLAEKVDVIDTRAKRKKTEKAFRGNNVMPLLWYDADKVNTEYAESVEVFDRILNQYYSGILLSARDLLTYLDPRFHRLELAVRVDSEADMSDVMGLIDDGASTRIIVVSSQQEYLNEAMKNGFKTCLYVYVDDKTSLHKAINLGPKYPYVLINFRDPTNIPLELVVAELQNSETVVIKEINDNEDVDDVINSMSTMEYGVEGLVITPLRHVVLDSMFDRLNEVFMEHLDLEVAEVVEAKPVGDGIRGCVDLSTMFSEDEGILVGSTSQGGFLCCPEVFEMPYMNKREFRVNAGGVHSYVFGSDNRTIYMSELRAGHNAMIVDMNGGTRLVPVGRVKLEKRPLRLITARFESGEEINILLQDDWHVRIYSDEGKPLHITELKEGTKVKAYKAVSGRHVGVPVNEYIEEV